MEMEKILFAHATAMKEDPDAFVTLFPCCHRVREAQARALFEEDPKTGVLRTKGGRCFICKIQVTEYHKGEVINLLMEKVLFSYSPQIELLPFASSWQRVDCGYTGVPSTFTHYSGSFKVKEAASWGLPLFDIIFKAKEEDALISDFSIMGHIGLRIEYKKENKPAILQLFQNHRVSIIQSDMQGVYETEYGEFIRFEDSELIKKVFSILRSYNTIVGSYQNTIQALVNASTWKGLL